MHRKNHEQLNLQSESGKSGHKKVMKVHSKNVFPKVETKERAGHSTLAPKFRSHVRKVEQLLTCDFGVVFFLTAAVETALAARVKQRVVCSKGTNPLVHYIRELNSLGIKLFRSSF